MTDPAPAPPSTSLSPALVEAKASLEMQMRDPSSAYWRDTGLQAEYADIVRAELAGEADYVGRLPASMPISR